MSEPTSSEKFDLDLLWTRLLKTVELSKIESTLAEALTGLANEEYKVEIKDIDFSPRSGSGGIEGIADETEVRLRIAKKDPFK